MTLTRAEQAAVDDVRAVRVSDEVHQRMIDAGLCSCDQARDFCAGLKSKDELVWRLLAELLEPLPAWRVMDPAMREVARTFWLVGYRAGKDSAP